MASEKSTATRCLIGTLIFFVLATVILAAILIWRELRREQLVINTTNLRNAYPGYFRSVEEQAEFEKVLIFNNTVGMVPVSNFTLPTNGTDCSVAIGCLETPQRRRKRDASQVLHGCCQSSVSFIRPPAKRNIRNVIRRIVQYEGATQNFMINTCSHVLGCSGSVCSQGQNLHTAVVYKQGITDPDDIEDTEVDFFYLDGCCKSVNS